MNNSYILLGQCAQGPQQRSTSPPFFSNRIKVPQKINGLNNVKKVVAGGNHCMAITNDGAAFGWGSNSALQLSHETEFSAADQPLMAVFSPIKLE